MGAHVEVGFLPSRKVIELFEMLDMIVRKNLPIGIMDDADYRYVPDLGSNHHLLFVALFIAALFIVACTGAHSSTRMCFLIN